MLDNFHDFVHESCNKMVSFSPYMLLIASTKKELLNVSKQRDLLRTEKESEVAALSNRVEQIQKSYEIIIGV